MKRVLSFLLSFVIAISMLTGMDVSVFAADEFSANKYLAQLSFGDEYIPYQTLESFYYDYQTGCEIVVDAAKNTSLESDIAAWYAIKSVANPGNAIDALNYQQQYELILYNVIFDALGSEQVEEYNYENSISKVSEFTNTLVESWNSADILDKTDLTGAESEAVKDAAMTFLEKSDTKWTALGEYSAIVNELAVCIESIITIGVDVVEIIDRVAIMVQLMDVGDAVVSFLYDIKANAGDVFLASAAQEVIDSISNDWVGIVEKVVTDVGFSFGKIATERLVNLAWGQVCSVVPFCAGMVIGDVVGTAACNALFATGDTVEEYSNMKKFIEVMSATRAAFTSTASACRNNINDDTAAKWIFSCDFMYSLIVSDYKCSVKFFEIINTKGLVNKVKNFFGGSGYEKYEDFCDSVDGILNSYESVYESFYTAWPYYMEEDYPDIYDSYIQKMNHPFETIITEVTSVDFIKDEYELAMNQTIKISAKAYPATAKNTRLTYSSSNTNVISVSSDGTITPVGEGTANVIATASNGVQGFCEITVYPYNVTENETGYTINKYLGSSTNVSIIDEINDIDVTIIGNAAFQGCTSLTSITIPDSVTSIGTNAFYNCTSLTVITIPDSMTSIGQCAFYNCTSLTSVTIGDSVTSIGWAAFAKCTSLTGVYISDITSWCNINFSSLSFSSSNPLYYADNLYLNGELVTDLVIPNSATSIGNGAFYYYSKLTSVTTGDGVTSIGSSAFYNCSSLTSVTIGDSVRSIGKEAFYSCDNLTSVTIGDSVTSIGSSTFAYCTSLTLITIPDSVTSIGSSTFAYCTSLTSITIPDSVTSINDSAFYNCSSLTSVTIPDGVTSIGDSAFYWCSNLTYINIPNSVTSIKASAFRNCGRLTSVIIPNGVTRVSDSVFYNCTSLTSVTIPDGVTSIGDSAFEGCRSLTTVTIPDSVTSIGDSAFYGCWLINTITIPNRVTSIGARAFVDCRGLTSVTISDSVMSIDEFTFSSCASLASITIPDGVTSIKSNAFANCSALEKIEIPNSVEVVDTTAFINDTKTVIYCQKNSSAHTFAIDNNISFIANDDNTSVDLKKHLIFTNHVNTDISEIMALSQGLTYSVNTGVLGTGALVDVMKDGVLHSQYTLVVNGDTNGDSVCNVLDVFEVERASSGHIELSNIYAIAADSNSDETIDINDYQAIVNKALAS